MSSVRSRGSTRSPASWGLHSACRAPGCSCVQPCNLSVPSVGHAEKTGVISCIHRTARKAGDEHTAGQQQASQPRLAQHKCGMSTSSVVTDRFRVCSRLAEPRGPSAQQVMNMQ